jgi:hypothetical protein
LTVRDNVRQIVDALPDVIGYLADLQNTDGAFSDETRAAIEEGLEESAPAAPSLWPNIGEHAVCEIRGPAF